VSARKSGVIAVDLSAVYNVSGIHTDSSKFTSVNSLDGEGSAYSAQLIGTNAMWDGVSFTLGPANAPDAVTGRTVDLPAGKFADLDLLATGVEGNQEAQTFTIRYSDGTSKAFTQSLSDWNSPGDFSGEAIAVAMPYRLVGNGEADDSTFHVYGYSFPIDPERQPSSLTLPDNRNVIVMAMSLVPAK
jgi:alpha-mannosidase